MKAVALLMGAAPAALAIGIVMLVVVLGGALGGDLSDPEDARGQPAPAAAAAEIPADLLPVYQDAVAKRCPGLPWTVLAAVGWAETGHARMAGGRRYPIPAGLGWAFSIRSSAGAQGPMQFMPATWASNGLDADADGQADVEDPVDAIHGAARYLCANGAGEAGTLRAALWRYNHDGAYVDLVLRQAERYGGLAPGSAETPGALVLASGGRPDVALYALRFLGVPYRWGGADPYGFDCSGLTQYVWARFGVRMPHYTVAQFRAFPRVPPGQEAPGDLVFFRGGGGEPPEHEGIYLGQGRFIHAPHTGDVVRIGTLAARDDYMGAARPGGPVRLTDPGP
jgi:cell wall-associated NlpC family hydrolase